LSESTEARLVLGPLKYKSGVLIVTPGQFIWNGVVLTDYELKHNTETQKCKVQITNTTKNSKCDGSKGLEEIEGTGMVYSYGVRV
jgi:hypothetical protein